MPRSRSELCARSALPPKRCGACCAITNGGRSGSALEKAEATGGTGLGSTRTVWVAKKPIHEEFIVWDEPRSWGFSVVEAEGPLGLVTETLNERVDIQVLSDDRVRVTYLMALQPKPRTGLLFRVLKRQLTKTLRQSLAGLERRIEAQRA